ncbi:MAG: hypothetical protein E7380_03685 [Clostridiales bacterium]|nr:hypothetical protein [Clostridiales bacterium]
MEEKEKKAKKKTRQSGDKKISNAVTKESILATVALFCVIIFLMLCTYDYIFGELGIAVYASLTGLFGYAAYPLLLWVICLSVAGLFGKRLFKSRRFGVCVTLSVLFIALILQVVTTYSWFDKGGYLTACFRAGESLDNTRFPVVTVAGWVGGVFVYLLEKLLSKVGTIIILSLLAVFFLYLSVVAARKTPTEKTVQETTETAPTVEIPLSAPTAPTAPIAQPVQSPVSVQSNGQALPLGNGYVKAEEASSPSFAMPTVNQRPGVSLTEETATANAFSPFAPPQEKETEYPSFEDPRAFLFSGTPAENYRKNLLFDPNANVNKRRADGGEGYMPSYTDAYQDSVNNNAEPVRPVKIVNDTEPLQNYQSAYPSYPAYQEPVRTNEEVSPFQATQATEPEREEPVRSSYEMPTTPAEPTMERTDREEYRRHEYMDLFSTSNPNVFGRGDGEEREERETPTAFPNENTDRFAFKEEDADRTRGEEEFTREERRSGINLLDDEEDSRLSGFERGRDIFDTSREAEERGSEDALFADRGVADRGAVFTPAESMPPAPIAENKPAEVSKPTPPPPPKPRVIRPYVRIPLDDLDCRDVEPTANHEEVEETKATIISTLEDFKVTGASIASVTFGPTVTRYNVTIPRNISPKKVVALDQSIAISLHSSGVNVYPNYEDGVVSIEVPNKDRQFVQLGSMLAGDTFVNAKPSSLMFTMGKDVANRKVYGDISKMIHLLVAGSSGSGKSVFLGSLIISLIYKYSPEELRLILIDPKKTEFVLYNDLPHLMINEIITDVNKAVQSLNWAIGEMNRRYGLFEQMSRAGTYVVNLDQYNAQLEKSKRLPKIVIIIDELADLMLAAKKEMEDRIQNLTQKARAAGIHLIVATQRPSTDVITGVIKSNLPTRVGFYVATDVDSRVILDQTGAQKLLGKGDFLYTMPGIAAPIRVQSAFISTEESQKVVNFIKNNNEAYYDEEATAFINSRGGYAGDDSAASGDGGMVDPIYIEALRHVILTGSASISMIQRKCSAGYNRAGKIVEWMEEMGYISPFDGAKSRKVLITPEEFESKYGPLQP